MFLWRVKSLKFIWKTMFFWWFRRLHVRMVKVWKKYQKWDQNPSEIQWKINTKNMLEKRAKIWKLIKKLIQKWSQNPSKSIPKKMRKKQQKKTYQTRARRKRRIPQTNHFKRHPAEWGAKKVHTLRKSNEGWVQGGVQKVKCKGKVQKGKCRRVSAERQVQTGNPQRT